ncbi:hypothetical protein [Sphingobium sp. TKS]|uniref:hypothetical protein n=1 Tax=Sphingobium sp. TKS TaxID=1315974 RepID=UPI0007704F87|nr:hypothetical protein [Sphingobium sp. TKS]AMK21929.1 hypothetical protein K426_04880 [Sphingobium sp. TKS]AMK23472.1 hypothetical protein K426_12695 [Sphingobium sp. TKS]
MAQGEIITIVLLTLVVQFGAGFVMLGDLTEILRSRRDGLGCGAAFGIAELLVRLFLFGRDNIAKRAAEAAADHYAERGQRLLRQAHDARPRPTKLDAQERRRRFLGN